MENLLVDLKASQPLLIATGGPSSGGPQTQENAKKRNLLTVPHLPRRLHLIPPQIPVDGILTHSMMQSLNTSVSSNVTSTPESLGCREENEEEAQPPSLLATKRGAPNSGTRRIESKSPFRHAEKKSKTKSG